MLMHEFDRFALREAFRLIHRFIALPAWKDYILNLSGDIALVDFSDDDQLDEYFRQYATTAMHALGSASMSPRGAPWGVTNPDLRLKGVRGIRVVDASVIVESILLFVWAVCSSGVSCSHIFPQPTRKSLCMLLGRGLRI